MESVRRKLTARLTCTVTLMNTVKKVKISVSTPCRHIEGVEVRLRSFLNFGARWEVSGQVYVRSPTLGKDVVPTNTRLGGSQSQYVRFGEGENLLPGYEPRIVQPVAYETEWCWQVAGLCLLRKAQGKRIVSAL
jgi:hypothetical protein